MKRIFLLTMTLFSKLAYAQVLEVNDSEKIVYYAPTPVLAVQLLDLQKDGGVLTLTLDYEGAAIRQQSEDLKLQFPAYVLKAMVVRPAEDQITIAIPEIGISKETILRQAQMGPLLSAQFSLKVAQVQGLKSLLRDRPEDLRIVIPVKAEVFAKTEVEVFETSMDVCSDLKVQTLADFATALATMKKPSKIRYDQTFDIYKQQLIRQCFELPSPVTANSFAELMRTKLKITSSRENLRAAYTENRTRDLELILRPKLKIEMN